jgi:hypothetical protein
MKDKVGKIFVVKGPLRRCLVCDVLFTHEASRIHSDEICFPGPAACPPITYGVMQGEA